MSESGPSTPKPERHERVETILGEITAILETSAESATEKLKKYVEMEPEPNQAYATLELFSDQNYNLAYNRFYVKEDGGKKVLDTKWGVNEDAAESFIPELDAYATRMFDGVDYTDAEQEDFGPRHSKQLYEWFKKCWTMAGGAESKTPTYFAMNKEYLCQDIFTGERFSEEEAARRLGFEISS